MEPVRLESEAEEHSDALSREEEEAETDAGCPKLLPLIGEPSVLRARRDVAVFLPTRLFQVNSLASIHLTAIGEGRGPLERPTRVCRSGEGKENPKSTQAVAPTGR
jgi:hypothetical protein